MRLYTFLCELVQPYTPGMNQKEQNELLDEVKDLYRKEKTQEEYLKSKGTKPTDYNEMGEYIGKITIPTRVKVHTFFEHPYFRLTLMYLHYFLQRMFRHWHETAGTVDVTATDDVDALKEEILRLRKDKGGLFS